MDFFFRIATVFLFALWQFYWLVTAKKADREKPKTIRITKSKVIIKYGLHYIVYAGLLVQLLDVQLLPFTYDSQRIGFFLVLLGMAISMSARKTLGTNWEHAAEYQIKQKQVLITQGIYAYIRNPIYTGLAIALIGAELVARSYLFLFVALFGFLVAYRQAKLEEKILEKHFGKQYTEYKKRTKMLIPFVV